MYNKEQLTASSGDISRRKSSLVHEKNEIDIVSSKYEGGIFVMQQANERRQENLMTVKNLEKFKSQLKIE